MTLLCNKWSLDVLCPDDVLMLAFLPNECFTGCLRWVLAVSCRSRCWSAGGGANPLCWGWLTRPLDLLTFLTGSGNRGSWTQAHFTIHQKLTPLGQSVIMELRANDIWFLCSISNDNRRHYAITRYMHGIVYCIFLYNFYYLPCILIYFFKYIKIGLVINLEC